MALSLKNCENAPLPGVQLEVLQNHWNRLNIVNRGNSIRVRQPLLAFQRFAELIIRLNRLLINGIGRVVVRISSQMSGLSTVSITFSFVKGPLASEVIALQVSAGTTFSQLKHILMQKHNACDPVTQQLKFVCVQTLQVLTDDHTAGSVAALEFDVIVNVIKKTAQSLAPNANSSGTLGVSDRNQPTDAPFQPTDACELPSPANPHATAPSPSTVQQPPSATIATGFFAGLGLDNESASGEYQYCSGVNLSHEQQQKMCGEMKALVDEEAATKQVDMAKFLSVYENMRKPEDRAMDAVLPVGTLVRLDRRGSVMI
jgi:hypothetical protein